MEGYQTIGLFQRIFCLLVQDDYFEVNVLLEDETAGNHECLPVIKLLTNRTNLRKNVSHFSTWMSAGQVTMNWIYWPGR
jgi:hypothetical protein